MNFQILLSISVLSVALLDFVATKVDKESRLIGASPASVGEFKWIVSLQYEQYGNGTYKHFCAGSIVDSTHIVTAGHCVWNKESKTLSIVAGALNISVIEDTQQRRNISSIFLHPNYVSGNRAGPYDIAVLELATAVIFDNTTGPIALPDKNSQASGTCKFSGWGNRFLVSGIYFQGSDVLRTISSYVIPRFLCSASYLIIFGRHLETALCTAAGPLRGSCQGDSGGPVTCYNEDKSPFLAGIVSWGWIVCGDGLHPDVSTDVTLFIDFIKQHLTPLTQQ